MDQAKAYRKFCKAHGGEDNAVQIGHRIIFADGAEAVNESVGALMIDHDENRNRYFSEYQKLQMRRDKAANVVLHRQTLYEIAVQEFEELKESLRGSLDRKGLKQLEALKQEVQNARKEVRRAERAAECIEPGYISPAERRRMDAIEAEEQDEVADYDASLDAIRL